jgi:hypothetical protein
MVTSLVATVDESRTTWLLIALVSLAARLAVEGPEELARCFPTRTLLAPQEPAYGLAAQPTS